MTQPTSPIKTACIICGIALSTLALPALAQHKTDHAGHAMQPARGAEDSPATKAFRASDDKMMKDMSVPYTGDADRDFVAHMIPHHEGAVAMAEVLLKHGKDPELRKLAQEIVAAQHKEIAFMKQWLARRGAR